jgi:anaerobic selenocysteine-containing dehydrogenase
MSPAVVAKQEGEMADWEIITRLAYELGGGPTGTSLIDFAMRMATKLGWRFNPQSALDMLLRLGPHGDRYVPWSKGINLKKVKASPYGVDLGSARRGFKHRLRHKDGLIHLSAAPLLDDMDRLASAMAKSNGDGELLLIGRRELRSNNSWMHNVAALVSGRERCVLYVNPADAARAGLRDSQPAQLESRIHSGVVPVRVTDEVMPGVVSLPHGWGHKASATWQSVAGANPGVSANDFTDDQYVEGVVGQSILNGVPVKLSPVREVAGNR